MRSPSRPTARRGALSAWLAVALLVGACSAGPISDVSSQPPTVPPSNAPSSVPPSEPPSVPVDSPSATATATPTDAGPVGEPGKPTGTTFKRVGEQPHDGGGVRQTYQVTWKAPEGEATSFRIYGVKDCLRESKANDGKPCLIRGMPIPKKSLALLAEVPGALRSAEVSWAVPRSGKQPYAAVLIRALNDAGQSIFTIVHTEDVCWRC